MTEVQNINTFFREAFTPTELGLDGIVDQIVAASVGRDTFFQRVGDCVVCQQFLDGEIQEAVTPIPAKNFRSILARIATLLHEHQKSTFNPYSGEGIIAVGLPVTSMIQISFTNTTDKQSLTLRDNSLPQPTL